MAEVKQRDVTFDIMKGIGVLLVMLGHTWNICDPMVDVVNSFHMPLFFIVAGYFSKSYDDIGQGKHWATVGRYFRRLYVPFAFATILLTLWFCVKAVFSPEYWNSAITTIISLGWASTVPLHTPWGNCSTGIVWFLITLFCSKTMFLFLSRWKKWVLPISVVLSFVGYVMGRNALPLPFCLSQSLIVLPYITIGWWWRRKEPPVWLILVCIVCWVLANIFSSMVLYDCRMDCYPLDLIGACGGTYVVYWISRQIAKYTHCLSKVLALFGVCSLAFICFHYVEINGAVGNHVMNLLHIDVSWGWHYVIRYSVTLVIAILAMYTPGVKKIFQ